MSAKPKALPADAVDQVVDLTSHMPPAMKASMALDLDRGNRLEPPWLGGKVVELGRPLGVPPTHSMMAAMLKPYIMGTPA
jgi:2-dehydropantoate 2-reductase